MNPPRVTTPGFNPSPTICPIITQDHPVPTKALGTADIIGFGQDGVYILRNNFQSASKATLSPIIKDFGYNAGGWRIDKHVRLIGDTTGNGCTDIIGFGHGGVWIAQNRGDSTFGPSTLRVQEFGCGAGAGEWTVDKHIRYVADLRGTGRVDIVGFSDWGVVVALNNGDGTFGPVQVALNDLGYEAGWRMDKHLRMLGDVTGNGLPDIVAFGEKDVFVAINNGDATFQPLKVAVSNNFAYSGGGWRIASHPRVLADLTGDGRVDIIGFADSGVQVSFNNGDGTFQPAKLVLAAFGVSVGGWTVDHHPRFVADVTGDGRGDIIGFGHGGVYVALNSGDGTFREAKMVLTSFGYDAGDWRVGTHVRFMVDLTGNGCVDIIGFKDDGVFVSYNDGKGNFGEVQNMSSHFGGQDGEWDSSKTIRIVANMFK